MEEFPSNAKKNNKASSDKDEPKKIEKVIQGEAVRRKKPLGKRFTETFVGGDAKGVWGYVFLDVLVPAAKDMIVDATSQGVERMIFGETRGGRRSSSRSSPNGYVSYNRYSPMGGRREEPRNISRRARATHDFDEIILPTRVEAEEVIDRMFDIVSQYETATVADLYELVGINSNYTDGKWGWSDFRGAGVSRVRNGYLLDLPRPESLD
jgi:hypothetical protein